MEPVPGRIVVFDDNPVSLRVLESGLSSVGHTVVNATTPDEALAILQSERFDVALIDLEAAEGSGLGFLADLRSHPPLSDMPLVVLSGDASREHVLAAAANRVHRFLVKPYDLNALLSDVGEILSGSDGLRLLPKAEVLARLHIDDEVYESVLRDLCTLANQARSAFEAPDEDGLDQWAKQVELVAKVSSAVSTVAQGTFMRSGPVEPCSVADWRSLALRDLRSLESQIEAHLASCEPKAEEAPEAGDSAEPSVAAEPATD